MRAEGVDGQDDFKSSHFHKVSLRSCPVWGGWSVWSPEKQEKARVSWAMEGEVLGLDIVKDKVILALAQWSLTLWSMFD